MPVTGRAGEVPASESRTARRPDPTRVEPSSSRQRGSAAVERPSPDVALADEATPLPGVHRGGFLRLPTAPVAVTTESAPAEPGADGPGADRAVARCPAAAPHRGLGGWALAFSIAGLLVSLFVGLGLPDRPRRRRLGDPRAAPPAREPGASPSGRSCWASSRCSTARAGCCSPRAARTCSADRAVHRAAAPFRRVADRGRRGSPTRFVPMRVTNERRRLVAAQLQRGPQHGGVDIHPPLLDLEPCRSRARAAPCASAFGLGGQHLAHAERLTRTGS